MVYRIAWCIKTFPMLQQYNYGDWQEDKKYNEMKDWCYKQNSIDSGTYYWIEKKEGVDANNVVEKNEEIETEFVKIDKC